MHVSKGKFLTVLKGLEAPYFQRLLDGLQIFNVILPVKLKAYTGAVTNVKYL
jgi:hypothetical protein